MNKPINYTIVADQALLSYLEEPALDHTRFSKYEAYVFLLNEAAEADFEKGSRLKHGQIETSFSELADIWNWHRTQARIFLCELAELGALAMERVGRSTIITMLMKFEGAAAPVRLIDEEERRWLRFIFGMAAFDEILSIVEVGMLYNDKEFAERVKAMDPTEDADVDTVGLRLRLLLNHHVLGCANHSLGKQKFEDTLRELFVEECHSDLSELFTMLAFGGITFVGKACGKQPPFKLTERAERCLSEIVRYYEPWLEHPLTDTDSERHE
jgi:hypothetical protein